MERIAIEKLIKWKDSPRRKPLVIEGARQVGKTWLVKEFAQRNYKQLAYVNFEDMKILQNLFVQDFDIPRVLTAIGAATHVTCTEGDTLIFLDEIQAAPNAITSLKYFCENAPGYHVIAAGSLLGIELHQGESFRKSPIPQFVSHEFHRVCHGYGRGQSCQAFANKRLEYDTTICPKVS